jgi:glycosyltransferase involved in cell wall biosynthesis
VSGLSPAAPRTLLICTPCHALHGGVERLIEWLHDGLPAHGFQVVVALARGERFHHPDRYRREYPTLKCVEIDGTTGTRAGRLNGVRRVLDETRPDLVLIARLFDVYEAVCERKLAGAPLRLAVTVDAYEAEYIDDLARYADFVDVCVTSGQMIAKGIRRFTTLPADRVRGLAPGVSAAERFVRPDDARPLRLGYVGRLEEKQKRVLDLPRVLQALQARAVPFTCRIAGSGSAEEELRRAIDAAGLGPVVSFDGWKSREDLYREVYPELDVLLHLSAYEGVTIAPREAMVHGVVPVVSRFVGCLVEKQFIHEHTALLFDVGDTSAAAAAVARLHEDRVLWRRLSAAARASQQGGYSDAGALAAWAAAFRDALAEPPRVGRQVPRLPWTPSGWLECWGIPADFSEPLRKLLGIKFAHRSPGGEWPHCSGLGEPKRLQEIAEFATALEARLRTADEVHA